MPKYAIFDTEPTGLFLFKDPDTGAAIPADDPRQPRLAHLNIILLDDDLQEEDEIDLFVKPDGWEMPAEAGAMNGLTTQGLIEVGTPIATVLDTYVDIVQRGYVMVAFNAQFDCKMMRGELRRAGRPDLFDDTPNICIMRAAMALGVKKAGGGRGFPKLTDCAAHLGLVIDEAHSAKGDTRAALALFRHLQAVGALPEAKVHLAKTPPIAPTTADVVLTEIHRQAAENPIVRMATTIREGGRLSYGAYGESRVITRSDLTQDDVMQAGQVLVGLNKTRAAYNSRMRQLHGRQSPMPEPGDTLVCLKNDRNKGIFNGGLWSVVELLKRRRGHLNDHTVRMHVSSLDFESTTPVEIRVRREFFEGRGNEVPWKELNGLQQFDYGYALTVHKAQGSQWDSVCLFDESGTFREHQARHLYTAITRAAERITIIM